MANRFWVGGSGNWSDNTNHWSATSNGAPGASLPTSSDSVFFDSHSFSAGSATVSLDVTGNCLDMDWTGATNTPVFKYGAGSGAMNIYGSLTLVSGLNIAKNSGNYIAMIMLATSTGKTITWNGATSDVGNNTSLLFFNSTSGGWTLQDDIVCGGGINVGAGNFNTGNKNITCQVFNSSGSNARTVTLGTSTITITALGGSNSAWQFFTTTNLTFSGASSTIIFTTNAGANGTNFQGGGLTYGTVQFSSNTMDIQGSNTFGTLIVDPGKTLRITNGTTQTVTNLTLIDPSGTITLKSTTNGSTYTISKASGTVEARRVSIQDCIATGGATFNDRGGTNVSGNSGWNFLSLTQTQTLTESISLVEFVLSSLLKNYGKPPVVKISKDTPYLRVNSPTISVKPSFTRPNIR